MSEDTEPTEPVEPGETPPTTDTEPVNDPDKPTGEAAKYRVRLREAEAQRDTATEQLSAARLSVVRQAAESTRGFDMTAFDAAGFDVAASFDESGQFSPDAFAAQIDELRKEKPYVFAPNGPVIPGQGRQPSAPVKVNGWEQAFGPPAL